MSILKLYLSEHLDDLNRKFIREAIKGNLATAKEIISEDPCVVNYQDEKTGITALMIFVSDGCGSMVDHICSVPEVDLSLEDVFGRSAGLMAMTIGRPDILARINERIKQGLKSIDPGYFDELTDDQEEERNVVRFPNPKAGSDPSP